MNTEILRVSAAEKLLSISPSFFPFLFFFFPLTKNKKTPPFPRFAAEHLKALNEL